jgi:hypothetical protein
MIRLADIGVNRDVKDALDALMLLELEWCPLTFIDKLFDGLLEILEYTDIRTCNLAVVYINLNLQFLSP